MKSSAMLRLLTLRKRRAADIRQLHEALENDLSPRQRRRAEVLLLYAAGVDAVTIARLMDIHINTVYADRRAFERQGVNCVYQRLRGGAPARITPTQREAMVRLAETAPGEVGLPYGRWSLSKLREYLLSHRVIPAISREHLRRVLKKRGCTFAMSNAS